MYRIQQFFKSLFVTKGMVDMEFVHKHLTAAQEGVFLRMQAYDRYHSVYFAKTLISNVYKVPEDLIVAALLHDVGKSRYPINSFHRMGAVVARRFAPQVMEKENEEEVAFLNRTVLVSNHHAEWSENMAKSAGVSDLTAWIIAHHEDKVLDESHPWHELLETFIKYDDLT
jgi:UTP:GlnB (protein PII) uridylyltransferase